MKTGNRSGKSLQIRVAGTKPSLRQSPGNSLLRYKRSCCLVRNIKDRVSIEERPRSVESRRQMGHWETDLLHPRKSVAAVLVAIERTSHFVLLAKQPGKHAKPIVSQLASWLVPLPPNLRRSLTQDNGTEFSMHHRLNPFGIKTYFCHPHHPWQKGSVENMNGRLRRAIPLGTDPNSFSNDDLQALADRCNHTPRKNVLDLKPRPGYSCLV